MHIHFNIRVLEIVGGTKAYNVEDNKFMDPKKSIRTKYNNYYHIKIRNSLDCSHITKL